MPSPRRVTPPRPDWRAVDAAFSQFIREVARARADATPAQLLQFTGLVVARLKHELYANGVPPRAWTAPSTPDAPTFAEAFDE